MAKSERSLKLPFPKPPFDEFLEERLKGFEEHLKSERLRPSSIEQRMRDIVRGDNPTPLPIPGIESLMQRIAALPPSAR